MRFIHTISLWQPFGSLLATGKKRIDSRNKPLPEEFNLPLVVGIYAAHTQPPAFLERHLANPLIQQALQEVYHENPVLPEMLPKGVILGFGRITQILPLVTRGQIASLPFSKEQLGGEDMAVGRYLWIFDKIHTLKHPIPYFRSIKSLRGVWKWKFPPAYGQYLSSVGKFFDLTTQQFFQET